MGHCDGMGNTYRGVCVGAWFGIGVMAIMRIGSDE